MYVLGCTLYTGALRRPSDSFATLQTSFSSCTYETIFFMVASMVATLNLTQISVIELTRAIWNLESFWNHIVNLIITTAKGSVYYITATQVLIPAEV